MTLFVGQTVEQGESPISSSKWNNNVEGAENVLNGGIEEENIKTSSKVMVANRNYTITGTHTFSTAPVLTPNSIPDSALSTNVSILDGNQTLSGNKTFSGTVTVSNAIEGLKVPERTTNGSAGHIYEKDGALYGVLRDGTIKQIDYSGGYTGGALRPYSGGDIIDQNNDIIIPVKTDATLTSVKLKLIGLNFPTYFYTELGQHSHAGSSLDLDLDLSIGSHTHELSLNAHTHTGSFASGSHTHSGTTASSSVPHAHDTRGNTGVQSAGHFHDYYRKDGDSPNLATTSGNSNSHYHYIDLATVSITDTSHSHTFSTGTPSSSGGVSSASVTGSMSSAVVTGEVSGTVTGNTSATGAGVSATNTQKTNFSTSVLQMYISSDPSSWGAPIVYDATGLFTSSGVPETDLTSYFSASSIYYIRLHLSTTDKVGGKILHHIDIN
jgi:hypothetical protein